MLEGDDDSRLREAKANRQNNPNRYYQLKKELEGKKKKVELQKREQQSVKKDLVDQRKKLKEDLSKKGVQTADQKINAQQLQKMEQQHEEAQKEQGQTENPAQAV